MNTKINVKRKKSMRPIIIVTILVLLVIIGVVMQIAANFYAEYNNPSLIGEWISEETGKIVGFEESGNVKVDNLITGDYTIASPGLIIYEIEGYTFEMDYTIEDRSLIWGLPGEEEKFERKGI